MKRNISIYLMRLLAIMIKMVDNGEVFDNCESTKTLPLSSYSSICNDLYNVIKNNNGITALFVGMLLEMKDLINSKNNKQLNLDQMITHFSNYKNTFTPSEKENILVLLNEHIILQYSH